MLINVSTLASIKVVAPKIYIRLLLEVRVRNARGLMRFVAPKIYKGCREEVRLRTVRATQVCSSIYIIGGRGEARAARRASKASFLASSFIPPVACSSSVFAYPPRQYFFKKIFIYPTPGQKIFQLIFLSRGDGHCCEEKLKQIRYPYCA